eukprot:gnl/MRDRNA2_/MRDRNA2_157881_c0_seq1.p1 gnl/MRDRNA2_/MRDRNA2_157881_c0~~gnl/MRDRNA2_/MRDRNA2_157881_c0_seq1.p1  ORF type:complete len:617 (-),score=131.77 gnl/MRDRNA2_/MRDRNA2_157881_c0_seq1:4-1809(-)
MVAITEVDENEDDNSRSNPWVYFAMHREWCDHMLFYPDGIFQRGFLPASGTWRLLPSGLELCWNANNRVEVLCSKDGNVTFSTENWELHQIGKELLGGTTEREGPGSCSSVSGNVGEEQPLEPWQKALEMLGVGGPVLSSPFEAATGTSSHPSASSATGSGYPSASSAASSQASPSRKTQDSSKPSGFSKGFLLGGKSSKQESSSRQGNGNVSPSSGSISEAASMWAEIERHAKAAKQEAENTARQNKAAMSTTGPEPFSKSARKAFALMAAKRSANIPSDAISYKAALPKTAVKDRANEASHGPVTITRSSEGSTFERRGLVFSSVGDHALTTLKKFWLKEPKEALFDVALVFHKRPSSQAYADIKEFGSRLQGSVNFELHHHSGFKWVNFRWWIEEKGGASAISSKYDYIWVADDDLQLDTQGINKMLHVLRGNDHIMFASPSFDSTSDGVWRYHDTQDARFILRYTDFVECMAVMFATKMLHDDVFAKCLRAVNTGCYIDFCFHPVCGDRPDSVAIIDAVVCHHPPREEEEKDDGMDAALPWVDHRHDAEFFQREGIPTKFWWWRKPQYFAAMLSGKNPGETPGQVVRLVGADDPEAE